MEKTNKSAERFKEVRKLLGITQQEMADRLFLTRNYIAKIESGAQEPSARVVRDLESLRVSSGNTSSTSLNVDRRPVSARAVPMESEIRALVEVAIRAAADRPERLGWVLEQVRAHLRAPAHWLLTEQERRAGEELYQRLRSEAAGESPAATPKTRQQAG